MQIEKFPSLIVPPTQTLSSVALIPLITIARDRSHKCQNQPNILPRVS
jgi:hypothetical protein